MTIVANSYRHVIGIDTHARTHTLAVVDTASGHVVLTRAFPASPAGRNRALAWITRSVTALATTLVVIEGAGSYGATIMRTITEAGGRVVEPMPVAPALRAGRGKSDQIDAELIARSVLAIDANKLRDPRTDQGTRAALRVLIAARDLLNVHRTATKNHLTALVRLVDIGIDARAPLTATQISTIARWRDRSEDIDKAVARSQARHLARLLERYDADLKINEHAISELVTSSPAAILLPETGIGTITAATIITSWSHAGRIRTEASFAALAGVSPIPASSGNTTRHRLNHGGDRRLNRALHTIVLTRMRTDPATIAYVERRRSQGRTTKEIRRSLKRYLARHIYRTLTQATA